MSESESEPVRWLVLVYRVPTEPSRLRAAIWRRLKGLGAIYLQNSVAALPAGPSAERALRALRKEVQEMGGTGHLLDAGALGGGREIEAAFNAARDDEYEEILDKCVDFHAQIRKEYDAEHFTYAELEENEEDLGKLRKWYAKIVARDVLGAARKDEVAAELENCAARLEEYAARVFREEDG